MANVGFILSIVAAVVGVIMFIASIIGVIVYASQGKKPYPVWVWIVLGLGLVIAVIGILCMVFLRKGEEKNKKKQQRFISDMKAPSPFDPPYSTSSSPYRSSLPASSPYPSSLPASSPYRSSSYREQ